MSKNTQILNFVKRNLYYLVIALALVVTAIVILAVVLSKDYKVAEVPASKPGGQESVITQPESDKEGETTESGEKTDEKTDDETENKPADLKIVFALPVENGSVAKDYTSSTVVFNKTLGVYTGHMGIDFSAPEGTAVVCAYNGTVESVVSSYLEGTTVTVDHGDGLKTVYNSIEVGEDITVGKVVSSGQVLGVVSDNNRQEYKDGAHLHFETILNGLKVDPKEYLMLAEK